MEETKICTRCGETKSVLDFNYRDKNKGIRSSECKPCQKIRAKEYGERNREAISQRGKERRITQKEHISEIRKDWRIRNIDKDKERQLRYREEHREEAVIRSREWREENPDKSKEANQRWRDNNKERHSEISKLWRQNNLERCRENDKKRVEQNREHYQALWKDYYWRNVDKIKEHNRQNSYKYSSYDPERHKQRMDEDPIYRLKINLRTSVRNAILGDGYVKKSKTFDIIGCDIDTVKNHLESKFTDGMSWDNKSEWHIDHRIPLSAAINEEELVSLCHYTNLQPLWAIDNLIKSNKYNEEEKQAFLETLRPEKQKKNNC